MITEQAGDILKITTGVICQQVNCQGVMGCGIALAIRRKWPEVYTSYRRYYMNAGLGKALPVRIDENLYVVNLFAQDRYGREKRHTDYDALVLCLINLLLWKSENCSDLNIYFPYKIGCSNAGGDWDIVKSLINIVIPGAIIIKKGVRD